MTICTHNREEYFGEIRGGIMGLNKQGCITAKYWQEIPVHFKNVSLDEWVVMPNHVHGILVINNPNNVETIHELSLRRNMLIPKIIGRFKMQSSKQINIIDKSLGRSVWQRSYYDRIIRNDQELYLVRKYIQNNPLKWVCDRNSVNDN